MKTEQYTYIETTHRTINKTVLCHVLYEIFPTSKIRTKPRTIDGIQITYVKTIKGELLGWATKEPGKTVKITIKNY